MSKIIEKIENYKKKTLGAAIDKLEVEYANAKEFYNDTGYDRYFKKMSKCEEELEKLYAYRDKDNVTGLTTDEYKEYLKMKQDLSAVKSKIFYLIKDLNLPSTAELIGIQDILRDY